ncbi:MAG: sigma-70 family RNA polymerase sigma factor [Candidatus Kapabacteria bacterium]|nr:sigma-70 family RNA polymerase sigma factor [Candidatus Kapabacteria bacterium]
MIANKIDKAEQIKISNEQDYAAVRLVLEGDNSAFQILQKKYKRILASLIRKMVRDEDDIEDLLQETFIKAYRSLHTFQFGYSFSSWLYRVASNNCIDFLRKKRFQTISIDQTLDPTGEEDTTYEIRDESYQPDLNYMNEERKNVLMRAIENLPENYRIIIKLRHEEDMDYNQIGEALNLPIGTVKAHIFRARKILLANLQSQSYLFQED